MSKANPVAELPADARVTSHALYELVQKAGAEWARLNSVSDNAAARGDSALADAARRARGHMETAARTIQDAYSELYMIGLKRAKEEE